MWRVKPFVHKLKPYLYKLLELQEKGLLIVGWILGFFIILTAVLLRSSFPLWAALLLALGASLLGTCSGQALARNFNASALQRVRELVENSLFSSLSASDQELEAFRRVWHHYLLTKFKGELIWRYRKLDFSKISVPGKLVMASFISPHPGVSRSITYDMEVFLVKTRLIFIQTPTSGEEPPIIHIYPRAGLGYRVTHAGLALLQDWDGDHLTVPVILQDKPIDLGMPYEEGNLDPKTYQILNKIWKEEANGSELADVRFP